MTTAAGVRRGSGRDEHPSSFTIVTVPCVVASVALVGALSVTRNVSFGSFVLSPFTVKVRVTVVWPAANVAVPLFAT